MHKFYPLLSTVFGNLHLLCGTLFKRESRVKREYDVIAAFLCSYARSST